MTKLQDIGFYTLSDERAKNVSLTSDLQRCELILTSRCNFNCLYCRGMKVEDRKDVRKKEAFDIISLWSENNLHNVRFSGGEPTLWPWLPELVSHSKNCGINRIAISTNGSADKDIYHKLLQAGVNDFSISLDSCCAATGHKMAGRNGVFYRVIENIQMLSALTYVTVGVVLTNDNLSEVNEIIYFASGLGVSDIRIIPAAQDSKKLSFLKPDQKLLQQHPILKYRFDNFVNGLSVRGISASDNHLCPLVIDDMAVMNGKHYPCIIYLREHGKEIGTIKNKSIAEIRAERFAWYQSHNCSSDTICKNNCLDVCVDYNNRVREINTHLTQRSSGLPSVPLPAVAPLQAAA